MKDKILNTLMLLMVCAALLVPLLRGPVQGKMQEAGEQGERHETGRPFREETPLPSSKAPALSPLESYRQQRAEARKEEKEALTALLQDASASPEIKEAAREGLLLLARKSEIELAVEGALFAKGPGESVCVAEKNGVHIFVAKALSGPEAGLILDLAAAVSGAERENIRISACSIPEM